MRDRQWPLGARRPPHHLVGVRRALGSALRPMADALGARRRLAWLNEAGIRIGTTLDLGRTAEELADFTVPELADGCAVDLLESVLRFRERDRAGFREDSRDGEADGLRLRAMAVSHVDGLSLAPARSARSSSTPPTGSPTAA